MQGAHRTNELTTNNWNSGLQLPTLPLGPGKIAVIVSAGIVAGGAAALYEGPTRIVNHIVKRVAEPVAKKIAIVVCSCLGSGITYGVIRYFSPTPQLQTISHSKIIVKDIPEDQTADSHAIGQTNKDSNQIDIEDILDEDSANERQNEQPTAMKNDPLKNLLNEWKANSEESAKLEAAEGKIPGLAALFAMRFIESMETFEIEEKDLYDSYKSIASEPLDHWDFSGLCFMAKVDYSEIELKDLFNCYKATVSDPMESDLWFYELLHQASPRQAIADDNYNQQFFDLSERDARLYILKNISRDFDDTPNLKALILNNLQNIKEIKGSKYDLPDDDQISGMFLSKKVIQTSPKHIIDVSNDDVSKTTGVKIQTAEPITTIESDFDNSEILNKFQNIKEIQDSKEELSTSPLQQKENLDKGQESNNSSPISQKHPSPPPRKLNPPSSPLPAGGIQDTSISSPRKNSSKEEPEDVTISGSSTPKKKKATFDPKDYTHPSFLSHPAFADHPEYVESKDEVQRDLKLRPYLQGTKMSDIENKEQKFVKYKNQAEKAQRTLAEVQKKKPPSKIESLPLSSPGAMPRGRLGVPPPPLERGGPAPQTNGTMPRGGLGVPPPPPERGSPAPQTNETMPRGGAVPPSLGALPEGDNQATAPSAKKTESNLVLKTLELLNAQEMADDAYCNVLKDLIDEKTLASLNEQDIKLDPDQISILIENTKRHVAQVKANPEPHSGPQLTKSKKIILTKSQKEYKEQLIKLQYSYQEFDIKLKNLIGEKNVLDKEAINFAASRNPVDEKKTKDQRTLYYDMLKSAGKELSLLVPTSNEPEDWGKFATAVTTKLTEKKKEALDSLKLFFNDNATNSMNERQLATFIRGRMKAINEGKFTPPEIQTKEVSPQKVQSQKVLHPKPNLMNPKLKETI